MQLGLQEQLLQDCMLDIAVTDDDVFLQQHVFSRGKRSRTLFALLKCVDALVAQESAMPTAQIMAIVSTVRVNAPVSGREKPAMKV